MDVQMELTKRGIPFTLTSGLRFFEQAHIKDVAAFLKFAINPRDEVAFKRMARLLPGIGNKTAETLWTRANAALGGKPDFARLMPFIVPAKAAKAWEQFVHTLCDLVPAAGALAPAPMMEAVQFAIYDEYMQEKYENYEARREDLATLAGFAAQFESVEEFLSQLALLGGTETSEAFAGEAASEKLTLSTLHQAKGLEWKVVFLIWLADGMFPSARSLENPDSIEEERRLFYVGVTRCKDNLYLTYPELRLGGGYGDNFQRPSRFLSELPESLMETWDVGLPAPMTDASDDDIPF
jgi:DNA helicase-2/ATP-dependent DNA helicase PcrA